MRNILQLLLVCLLLSGWASCTRDDETLQNTEKELLSFTLRKADGTEIPVGQLAVTFDGLNINVLVPFGIVRNPLIAEYTFKGFSASPASGTPQNFDVPVRYTVTAEDGSSAVYTVTVTWGPPPLVYFGGDDGTLYALNGSSGNLIWKLQGGGSFVYSSPTYANGTIYSGNTDGYVYAVHPATGALKWKQKLAVTGIESDAVCVNGTVYVGTNDDYLFALDTANGQTKWSFLTGGNVSASPTVENGVVYFGSSDGNLYALDAATGQRKWTYPTGAMINQSGPALVNGVIYVGSRDTKLHAVRASDGSRLWAWDAAGISLEQSSPTVVNGTVYVGGWYSIPDFRPGSMYALDAATGQLRWEKLNGLGIGASPFVSRNRVFISADDRRLYALDATTGNTLWSKEILPNGASAVAYEDYLYVGGGGSRYFYALNVQNGEELWRFSLPNSLSTSSPLVLMPNGTTTHPTESGSNQ